MADQVWDGRAVSPETIAQRIKLLRTALHDRADAPRYIEVVRGQGYRWIPDVVVVPRNRPKTRNALDTAAAHENISLELPDQPSVVVLPLNTLGDEQLEHRILADGLTHYIITSVGRAHWLFVVARGSAFMFRGDDHFVQDVGHRLGVRYVVQGSIAFSGQNISVNISLAGTVSGQEIWSEHFGGKLDDIFKVQQQISNLVVGSIETEIEHAEQKRAMLTSPANLDAWSAYHRAWWHLNSYTEDCCDQAERFFKQSLQLDPNFARTYAGISSVHWIRAFQEMTGDREGAILQALDNAHMGVSMDPRDPLAHWAMGRAYHLHCDFERAYEEFEFANDLNPNFALGRFAQGLAMMLSGDNEDSNVALNKARRLSPYDPMSYAIYGVKAINNAMLGRYDRAADLSDRGAEMLAWRCQMFPVIAAMCNAIAGRNEIAQDYFAQLTKQRPDYTVIDYLRAFPHQLGVHVDKVNAAFDVLQNTH